MSQRNFWPDPEQLHLLHLCLQKDTARAIEAWEQWKKRVDLDDLDHGSFRIMSLAYTRLLALQIQDPDMARIKGIYRYQWTRNKMAFRGKADLLRALAAASIPTLLLKGAALCHTVYEDPNARPMHDLDLLVPVNTAVRAVNLLQERGWKAQHFAPEVIIQYLHACSFLHPEFGELDLHWHVLRSYCDEERDIELWEAAQDHTFDGVPTKILCPADQLLHACEHGMHHSPSSSLQWLVDACFILRNSRTPMDWQRLVDQASKFKLTLPLLKTLSYLQEQFDEPIPYEVQEKLNKCKIGLISRTEYFLATRPEEKQGDMLQRMGLYLCQFIKAKRDRSKLALLKKFPLYLLLVNHYERGIICALLDILLIPLVRLRTRLVASKLHLTQWLSGSSTARAKRVMAFSAHEIKGFHRPETMLSQTFRWSEQEASLKLTIPRRDSLLVWEFPGFYNPTEIKNRQVQFFVNNVPLIEGKIYRLEGRLDLLIPREVLHEKKGQILSWSVSPFHPGAKDPRSLGLPLFQIWVCPKKERGSA